MAGQAGPRTLLTRKLLIWASNARVNDGGRKREGNKNNKSDEKGSKLYEWLGLGQAGGGQPPRLREMSLLIWRWW